MSEKSERKTVLNDPWTAAAVEPAKSSASDHAKANMDSDHRYKIKKLSFHPSTEAAAALLETAVKLDNAVARTVNKMLALGKGKSKHTYKKANRGKPQKDVAYSESTARGQYQIMHVFIGWALNKGKVEKNMTLPDLVPFIQEFLDEKNKSCTPNTVHTYAALISKTLGLNMEEYEYPLRRRADVIAHRSGLEAFCKTIEKYPDLLSFCLATGLRKYKELGRLKGTDLQTDNSGLSLFVRGKGGLIRHAPVVGSADEAALVARLCREAGDERVFPALPANLDLHVFRAMYACRIYLLHARDVSMLQPEEQYACRSDYRGIILDRAAMEIASRALGHKRIGIVAKSYIWPLEAFLRGGILASQLPRAEQTCK